MNYFLTIGLIIVLGISIGAYFHTTTTVIQPVQTFDASTLTSRLDALEASTSALQSFYTTEKDSFAPLLKQLNDLNTQLETYLTKPQ